MQVDCPAPCLGLSFRTNQPVVDEMKERVPATISVAFGGAFLYLLFGIPIGVAAAQRRGTVSDKALVSSFLFLSSIPYYLFALLFYLYLTVIYEIPIFSDTGYTPFTENPYKWFTGLFLAWVALGIYGCTSYTRYSRGSMVEALSEDYIRTARSQGSAETQSGLQARPAGGHGSRGHDLRARPRRTAVGHDLHPNASSTSEVSAGGASRRSASRT